MLFLRIYDKALDELVIPFFPPYVVNGFLLPSNELFSPHLVFPF